MARARPEAPKQTPLPADQPQRREFEATEATRPKQAERVRAFPMGETEVLLFAEGRQVVHTLNVSAWSVWELCDGTRTVRQIADELSGIVRRPAGDLLPDVTASVRELGSLGLLNAV